MTYWIFALATALISGLFFYTAMRRAAFPLTAFQVFGVAQVVILSGFFLSRLGTLVEERLEFGFWPEVESWYAPVFHWYGDILGIALVWLLLLVFSNGENLRGVSTFFGIFAQMACIIFILGKIGCFADGHHGCIGGPTELPWGVTYSWGVASSSIPLHPSQLYSAAGGVFLFVLLRFKIGVLWSTPVFLIVHATSEFGLEFLKPMPRLFFGVFSLAHVTYFLIAIIGIIGLGIMRLRKDALADNS